MNIKTSYLFFLILCVTLPTKNLFASPYELSFNKELAYLGIGTGISIAAYINEHDRNQPSLSEINALDKNDIPAFERSIAGRWNQNMHTASYVVLAAGTLAPLSFLFLDKKDHLTISLLYAETLLLSGGGTLLSKAYVTRFRPYVYGENAPLDERLSIDAKRSFFSGHAAITSSGLFFTATVFSDYYPDSRYNTPVWTSAIVGSLLVAGMRVASGRHFPSDVVVGLIYGSIIGYAVPASHRKKSNFIVIPYLYDQQSGLTFSKNF